MFFVSLVKTQQRQTTAMNELLLFDGGQTVYSVHIDSIGNNQNCPFESMNCPFSTVFD